MTDAPTALLVLREDLHQTRWEDRCAAADARLPDGAARFRIDAFALTSNNITYAAFGEAMNYWRFFPADDAAWGRVPVWGFAVATESRCPGLEAGERVYGYWPLASHAVLRPERLTPAGFVDGAEHRRDLHAVYNHYLRCAADPAYDAAREAEQALLRPLFTTSFLIDDFLADQAFFGARQVLLSSASSKTAYGSAFCLSRRSGQGRPRTIGLTSAAHLEFCRALGCYDEVHAYDDLAALDASVPAIYVDFSGSAALRSTLHHRFGDRLAYSCAVGGTHWDALGGSGGLPGPRPTLFFAPAQIKKRSQDWGAEGLQQRLALAWSEFITAATNARRPWLTVVRGRGRDAVLAVYTQLLEGRSRPEQGHMLSL